MQRELAGSFVVVTEQDNALVVTNDLEHLVSGRDHLRVVAFVGQESAYLTDVPLLNVAFILRVLPIVIDGVELLSQLAPPNAEPGIVCSRHRPGSGSLAKRKRPV